MNSNSKQPQPNQCRDGLDNITGGQYNTCETSRPNVQSLIDLKIKEHHTQIEELQALRDSLPSRIDMQRDYAIFRLLNRIK